MLKANALTHRNYQTSGEFTYQPAKMIVSIVSNHYNKIHLLQQELLQQK